MVVVRVARRASAARWGSSARGRRELPEDIARAGSQRGRRVAPFMDAAVVVIPRRAGSFRGPGGGGGDPATAARTTEAPRRTRERARGDGHLLRDSARATQPRRP